MRPVISTISIVILGDITGGERHIGGRGFSGRLDFTLLVRSVVQSVQNVLGNLVDFQFFEGESVSGNQLVESK